MVHGQNRCRLRDLQAIGYAKSVPTIIMTQAERMLFCVTDTERFTDFSE